MRCKICQYSLEGLSEHRCPECGNAFDPNDPNSWELDTIGGATNWVRVLMLSIAGYSLAFIGYWLVVGSFLSIFHFGENAFSAGWFLRRSAVDSIVLAPIGYFVCARCLTIMGRRARRL